MKPAALRNQIVGVPCVRERPIGGLPHPLRKKCNPVGWCEIFVLRQLLLPLLCFESEHRGSTVRIQSALNLAQRPLLLRSECEEPAVVNREIPAHRARACFLILFTRLRFHERRNDRSHPQQLLCKLESMRLFRKPVHRNGGKPRRPGGADRIHRRSPPIPVTSVLITDQLLCFSCHKLPRCKAVKFIA